jgi:(2Fe-2S) ferredoxin
LEVLSDIEDLKRLRQEAQRKLAERQKKVQVKVHRGTCGISSGANAVLDAFLQELERRKLTNVIVSKAGCIGLCGHEPTVTVIHPNGGQTLYLDVTVERVPQIVEQHVVAGSVIEEWIAKEETPFFKL